jgi:AraC family transcriptional regulator of adaptative response/methylated-DNA-[protein]-cysteine methyltransferase
MAALSSEKGVSLLAFQDSVVMNKSNNILSGISTGNNHLEVLEQQLREYFEGSRQEFTVELDITGTPFQLSVWNELLSIGYGETRSYTGQSAAIGKAGSVRAVANANAANRIAIVIPCHRIIGAKGNLTGYSGGLYRKKWLLEHEHKYSLHNNANLILSFS